MTISRIPPPPAPTWTLAAAIVWHATRSVDAADDTHAAGGATSFERLAPIIAAARPDALGAVRAAILAIQGECRRAASGLTVIGERGLDHNPVTLSPADLAGATLLQRHGHIGLPGWHSLQLVRADVLRLWPAPVAAPDTPLVQAAASVTPAADESPAAERPEPEDNAPVPVSAPSVPNAAATPGAAGGKGKPGRRGELPKVQAAFRGVAIADVAAMNARDRQEIVKAYCYRAGGTEVPNPRTTGKHVRALLASGQIGKEWETKVNNGKILK